MSRRTVVLLLAVLALVASAGVAWAQVSPGYDLSWHVLSAGGIERASSGQYMVHGTVSQFAIGPAAGAEFAVGQGYWYGINTGFYLYVPLLFRSSGP